MYIYLSKVYLIVFTIWFFSIFSSCSSKPQNHSTESHIREIQDWHQKRIASLTRNDSWLTLAGLFWLQEGANTFGADASNSIHFPEDKAPAFLGTIFLEQEKLKISVNPDVEVLSDGTVVTEMGLFSDQDEKPTVLNYGSLSWYIIKRGDKFGIRLKDSESESLKKFSGIELFPVDSAWNVTACYIPFDTPKMVSIPNVLGTISEEPAYGTLEFTKDGQTWHLDPMGDGSKESLFLIFADYTNGEETYGAGRFLAVEKPDEDGFTKIDFNKAYNPPCAFTRYATCPLPPQQNYLKFRVTAGEKNFAGAHH